MGGRAGGRRMGGRRMGGKEREGERKEEKGGRAQGEPSINLTHLALEVSRILQQSALVGASSHIILSQNTYTIIIRVTQH